MTQQHDVTPQTVPEFKYKYCAFISYSHEDEAWATWLHKALERYRTPKALVKRQGRHGEVPKRLFPIFRDRDELPGAARLSEEIEHALQQSRFLLVICSPKAAVSKYVNEEIKMFKQLGRKDQVLCVIVDGEPNATDKPDAGLLEAFPEGVRFEVGSDGALTEVRADPIAADARKGKDGKKNALLKILAGMLGVGYDELKQREKRRQIVRRLQFSAVAIAVSATIFGVWWSQLKVTEQEREIALARELAPQAKRILEERGDLPQLGVLLAIESMQRLIRLDQSFSAADRTLRQGLAMLPRRPVVIARLEYDVRSAIFSSDSRWLAVTDGSTMLVWDVATGKEAARLKANAEVRSVVFGPDSKWLAMTDGRIVRVLEAGTWTEMSRMVHAPGELEVAGISPDGRWLAVANGLNVLVWEVATSKKVGRVKNDGEVESVVFDAESRKITIVDALSARSWDVASWRKLSQVALEEMDPRVLSPNGHWLAIRGEAPGGNGSATVQILVTATGNHVSSINAYMAPSESSIVFSPNGKFLAASSYEMTMMGAKDSMTQVWDVETGQKLARIDHETYISELRFSPDGRWLIASDQNEKIALWESATGRLVYQMESDGVFSPDSDWLVTADGPVGVVRDSVTGRAMARLVPTDGNKLRALYFNADSNWLATADGSTISLWDLTTVHRLSEAIRESTTFSGHQLTFSGNGNRLAAISEWDMVVWDARTGHKVAQFEVGGNARLKDFSHDGQWLATTAGVTLGASKLIRIWNVDTGHSTKIWANSTVTDAKFSPDGLRVMVGSYDGAKMECDSATGEILSQETGEEPAVVQEESQDNQGTFTSVTNDGKWKLTVSGDENGHTARVLNNATGEEVTRLLEGAAEVALSPDQRSLVTISRDGALSLWLWQPQDLIVEACSRLTRNMSINEWSMYFKDDEYSRTCPDLSIPKI